MDKRDKGLQGMDQKEAIAIAKKYIRFLVKNNFDVTKAYLFGSYTKGSFNENSDIDLAVVIHGLQDAFDTHVELMKLRRKIDTRIEPHLFDESDFDMTHPMASEILKNGIEINALQADKSD